MYMLNTVGIENKKKPIGVSANHHPHIADCVALVQSVRPKAERTTAEDPYLQLYWYFEDLCDKYVSSDRKDTARFTGYESSYASCFIQSSTDDELWKAGWPCCDFCSVYC